MEPHGMDCRSERSRGRPERWNSKEKGVWL